jgi:hypothetical protein
MYGISCEKLPGDGFWTMKTQSEKVFFSMDVTPTYITHPQLKLRVHKRDISIYYEESMSLIDPLLKCPHLYIRVSSICYPNARRFHHYSKQVGIFHKRTD